VPLKEINRGSWSLKGSPSPKIAMHLRLAVQPRTAQVASHFGRDARPDRPASHFLDALASCNHALLPVRHLAASPQMKLSRPFAILSHLMYGADQVAANRS